LDLAQNGKINYSEFLSATIDLKDIPTEKIYSLFCTFDMDNDQKLSSDDLILAFTKFGRDITNEELAEIMKKHDKDKVGGIDYNEFE
jgi:Ca2+-binding EF-hand superfamily protein